MQNDLSEIQNAAPSEWVQYPFSDIDKSSGKTKPPFEHINFLDKSMGQ